MLPPGHRRWPVKGPRGPGLPGRESKGLKSPLAALLAGQMFDLSIMLE